MVKFRVQRLGCALKDWGSEFQLWKLSCESRVPMTLPHAIGDLSVGSHLGQQRAKSPVVFYQPQVQLVHLVLRLRFR